jgi:formamidopyrimidine-DNA glycosylase
MHLDQGNLIWHLGMSGSMRILPIGVAAENHEHVELQLGNGQALKFRDPRRFGALLYCDEDPLQHRLLRQLGPEPLGEEFNADYLYQCCRKRSAAIKMVLMNSHIVVGVGNIYASEALFLAGIRPARAARRISKPRLEKLVNAVRDTLSAAIAQGGTTLQDFTQVDGKPGYFRHELQVYAVQGLRPAHKAPGSRTTLELLLPRMPVIIVAHPDLQTYLESTCFNKWIDDKRARDSAIAYPIFAHRY